MSTNIFSLIESANEQMKSMGLSDATIKAYQQRTFSRIISRYEKEGDFRYCQRLMDDLLLDCEIQFDHGQISRQTRNWRRRGVHMLQEIYASGNYTWKPYMSHRPPEVPKVFESLCSAFQSSLCGSDRRQSETMSIIRRFFIALEKNNISDISKTSPDVFRSFLALMHETRPKSMDAVIAALRKLFLFLEAKGYKTSACWMLLASPRSRDHSVKPAITQDEIYKVIQQIERSKAPGKRDFAILSLAATTGLRAGDIVSLSLKDILWRAQEIRVLQGKTGHRLSLPLQPVVRDALADYILNERPDSTSEAVFLRCCAPYGPFHDGAAIACIFRKYLKKAGINHRLNDGKTFHGIRRSLGTSMAANGVPVTTVSQVLGHQGIRATRQYISLDVEGLRKCALSIDTLGDSV